MGTSNSCGLGQNRPVPGIVKVGVAEVRVGVPALETQVVHAPVELSHRVVDVLRSESRESAEAVRVPGDSLRQKIVRVLRHLGTHCRIELLHPRRGQRQVGAIDAGSVHVLDAAHAEIRQLGLLRHTAPHLWGEPLPAVLQPGIACVVAQGLDPGLGGEMTLEIDLPHRTCSFPPCLPYPCRASLTLAASPSTVNGF